eukprot:3550976-Amphidinium_carterae.3
MISIEQLIWDKLMTRACAPMVRYLFDDAVHHADIYPMGNPSATEVLANHRCGVFDLWGAMFLGEVQFDAGFGRMHALSLADIFG